MGRAYEDHASGAVPDPKKWEVGVYMTGRLSPTAEATVVDFISNPEAYNDIILSLGDFVIPRKPETKVINYIKDNSSIMRIWRLKPSQPYGSIGILDESKGDQWVQYNLFAHAQGSKRVHANTSTTGTPNPGTSSRPPKMPKSSCELLHLIVLPAAH